MIYDINILTTPFSIVFYAVPLALIVVLTIVRAGVLLSPVRRRGSAEGCH